MIASASRLYHTAIHLKPVQIYRRALYTAWQPRPRLGAAPPRRTCADGWVAPIEKAQSLVGPQRFRLLNRDGAVRSAADWNDPEQDALWLYNLHYFDDLTAVNATARRGWHQRIIDQWIVQNPAPHGVGWQPYPTSLRIVNWIKWALGGAAFTPHWFDSLAVQARQLERRLERHLLGNHLLANAKALVFAGTFFQGPEAERWLRSGLAILDTEIREQVLPDGGHFELSPMYHAIVLEDLLDLIDLGRAFPCAIRPDRLEHWGETARRMSHWLAAMTHPDGGIAFFNDAALGIAPEWSVIDGYGAKLGLDVAPRHDRRLELLEHSGYARLEDGEAVAFLDVGPVGPDHLPGHAHADTLSFELSLGGERVVVNGGTSVYGSGPQRQHERSTAAHSTVEVDGENSSDVWAGFRVARRARPFGLTVACDARTTTVSCSHDGYRTRRGRPTHRREWAFSNDRLRIADTVEGHFEHAVARFHLGPNVSASLDASDNEASHGRLQVGKRTIRWRARGPATLQQSSWHPEFGLSRPIQCIAVTFTGSQTETVFAW